MAPQLILVRSRDGPARVRSVQTTLSRIPNSWLGWRRMIRLLFRYWGSLVGFCHGYLPSLDAAGVDLHGVHDLRVEVGRFSGVKGAEKRMELNRIVFESSPTAHVDTWRSPVLIVHGDDNRNVFFRETADLIARLRDRDVPVRQLVLPNEVHSFLPPESWLTAFESAADFFDESLQGIESEADGEGRAGDRVESGPRRSALAPQGLQRSSPSVCALPTSRRGGSP